MEIKKIETNYKKKIFLKEAKINPKTYKEKLERDIINVYPNIKFQKIIGFGGAITQSSGVSYQKLSNEKKEQFIKEYFLDANYSLCRIPIGSCDFSPKSYSYSNKEDLSDFSMENDCEHIVPLIQDALKINPNIRFLASPWSPPKFMKTNKMLILGGRLSKKYYKTYAEYLAKYIEEYKNIGINIEFITIQNETNAIQLWESCLFNEDEETEFIENYLCPIFQEKNIKTKILAYDHNKEKLLKRAENTYNKSSNIDGIAFHWYTGDHFENIELCKMLYKDKLLIHTEGCVGFSNHNINDEIGNAELYAHDIIGDLNHGCNGYIDWNILLDYNGGPNHKRNYCDSPIMLNKEQNDYEKKLAFYYISHFSKTIKPKAQRIANSKYTNNIEVSSFVNEDGSKTITMLNKSNHNIKYNLCIDDFYIQDEIEAHTILSYIINL